MQAIKAYTQIYNDFDGQKILEKIEKVARTCYKSEGKIQEGSAAKMVASLIKSGHEAMLEHVSVTVKFVVDRGISHELVRHRLASFAQESTRYCNYSKDDFGSEITFIIPEYLDYKSAGWNTWKETMKACEDSYFKLLDRLGGLLFLQTYGRTTLIFDKIGRYRHCFRHRTTAMRALYCMCA